mmetsp:Transcript_10453/g.18250  ORF Transcript_10453/g.18250 Transcript_10453/m.18250 type:complete len:173 (-) Transcript_10453:997-1515(-)
MGAGRERGPIDPGGYKKKGGAWQRPNKDEAMRAILCEALLSVASERPTKAQHAQDIEMSIYGAALTRDIYLEAATASHGKMRLLLQQHIPRAAAQGRQGPQSVIYPRAPLPGSVVADEVKAAAVVKAAKVAAKQAAQEAAAAAAAAAGGSSSQAPPSEAEVKQQQWQQRQQL